MRILYDDSLAANPAGTGSFVRGLRAALLDRTDVEIVIPRSHLDGSGELNLAGKRLLGRVTNAGRHLRYYGQELPSTARRDGCDAIFCPTSLGPLRGHTPSFITLFDLSPLTFGSTMDRISGLYLRGMLRVGLTRSAGVCTISHAVAREFRRRFPRFRPNQVGIAHPGPNPALLDATPFPANIGAPPFLLMIGTLEPRKNHITVIRALADHLGRHPGSALRLVLAGSAGWLYEPVLRAIIELGLASRVSRLGPVEPGVLKWLYQHAAALLFPSLYEGFGLPVLEAFYLGCPVVAARIDAVAEVSTDEAALLLEPTDVRAWAAAIDVIEAGALPRRMIEAGRQRAQQFTWAGCAAAVVRLVTSSLAISD